MPSSAYTTSSPVTTPFVATSTLVVPVIDEILFPDDIAEGATGGPMFSTIVIAAGNGTEQREAEWQVGRYKFDISPGIKSQADAFTLVKFFVNRTGKHRGFRFKDWTDYTVTDEALVVLGGSTVQLIKTYGDGLLSYVRTIFKPSTTTFGSPANVTLKRNSVNYTGFTLDETTGIITLTPLITKNITAITKASSAVVTVGAAHGFVNGDVVQFSGVVGMTEINGLIATVTGTAATTITVNINSTGFTTYSSGGTCNKYVQPTDTLTWTGEFHLPMRFDVDDMNVQNMSTFAEWTRVPLIELIGDDTNA